MTQAAFFEPKRLSPTALATILALHAGAIAALALARIDVVKQVMPPTIVDLIEDKPVPPDVVPEPKPQTRREVPVRAPEPVVDTGIDNSGGIVLPPLPPVGSDIGPIDPPPPSQPPMIQSARAKGDVRQLIHSEDYPDAAIRNGDMGSVRAQLAIAADGKVAGCTIVASSGSAALDSATCRILKARARFAPARDSNGAAVNDTYVTPKITWRLEGEG